jgi:PAS domain-containing protein
VRERIDEVALDILFQARDLGLAMVDADKRYVRINEAFAAMNGAPVGAHIGYTPREVIPQIAEAVEGVLDHVLQTKLPLLNVEVDPSGDPSGAQSVRVSLYPLIDGTEVLGVLAVAMARA